MSNKAIFNVTYTAPTPPAYCSAAQRADYLAERRFYDLSATYNHLTYTSNGKKIVKNCNAEHYFTREGSNTGLFNLSGALNKKQVEEIKQKLKTSKSIIWHGFISFNQEVSKGFTTQEKAIHFMRHTFNSFLASTHLNPKNIEMYCALHDDKPKHHHIHFCFYEKEPMRRDKEGKLGYTKKGLFGMNAISNYMVSMNLHLTERETEYYSVRDAAIDELKNIRRDRRENKLSHQQVSSIHREIAEIYEQLPKTGRLQYFSPNMAVFRNKIDRVALRLVNLEYGTAKAHRNVMNYFDGLNGEIKTLVDQDNLQFVSGKCSELKMDKVWSGKMPHSVSHADISDIDYVDRLKADYMARLGNIVLGICKDIKKQSSSEWKRYARVNDKRLKIRADRNNTHLRNLVGRAINTLAQCQLGVTADFQKTVQQNERDSFGGRRY